MISRPILVASVFLFAALLAHTGRSAAPSAPVYDLAVSFDIPRSTIAGSMQTAVRRGERRLFRTGGLTIRAVEVNRKPLPFQVRDGALILLPSESGALEVRYEGVFPPPRAVSDSRDTNLPNVIGREGIFLTSAWYPQSAGLAIYRLKASLPRDYVAVSEAETIRETESDGAVAFDFRFAHPVDGISLVASDRYQITRDRFRDVELSAYFFPEDRALAATYLAYAKKYLELYEKLLLPFPFKRFAIVENFLPTGLAMPTYTLLGRDVVRLPFIVETSLGHEVLHQWFGNQVYAGGKGNWTEGLTTYLADHLYAEQKGEGWSYRKQILLDYKNYLRDDNDFPLKDFTARHGGGSRSVGYGKAAMVFHMLRDMLGDESFFGALKAVLREKQFQRASWDDWQSAFERQSGTELGWFFAQWLERKGLAELKLDGFAVTQEAQGFTLNLDLSQQGDIYRLDVPVRILYRSGGEKTVRIRLEERKKRARIDLAQTPAVVVIDDNYDVARRLSAPEAPPLIASLIGADKRIVVPPVRDGDFYKEVIAGWRARGSEVKAAESLSDAELRSATLVLLGGDHPVARRLYGEMETPPHGFSVTVKKNPWNPAKSVGIISARSRAEAGAAFGKIFHYGKYSQLAFENGRNVSATVETSERGMRQSLKDDPPAVEVSSLTKLSTVVDKLAGKTIVYVGEEHEKFSHHLVQLEILRGLHGQSPKVAVGMEMFQKPFQPALDDYIAGAIDERTFLKRSEYFKRWTIDYHLYKPILDFARAQRLPVIALNLPREIVNQVAGSGLDSLSKEAQRDIPADLDLSDQEYRGRLKEVFAAHGEPQGKSFDFFYQAQILWDETMAEAVDRFLKSRPDYRMVVLAGAGHLKYGSGIPKRAFRRNGYDYAVVLSDAEVKNGVADFVVFPEPATAPAAPKLGVSLDTRDQRLRITSFGKESGAEKAGLKVDDTLISLDDQGVSVIEDVRIALFYKQSGETVKVKARRGAEELEFDVKLR
jgi:uncharacterized iron-regulated protein